MTTAIVYCINQSKGEESMNLKREIEAVNARLDAIEKTLKSLAKATKPAKAKATKEAPAEKATKKVTKKTAKKTTKKAEA